MNFRRGSSRRGGQSQRPPERIAENIPLDHILIPLDEGSYIAFDIETTGGNPERNGITEIFAVKYHKGVAGDTFYSMVNPGVPIPPIVRRMTGINNQMVKDAPPITEVMPKVVEFLGNGILVSHNTIGDMKFLQYFAHQTTGKFLNNFFLCTHLLVDKLVNDAPNKSLKGLAKQFNLANDGFHRAEGDAWVTLGLFKILFDLLKERGFKTIDQAIRFQGDIDSALRLGWGIDSEEIDRLPGVPGVFYMLDQEKKPIYCSAASNIQRDMRKLQRFMLLPRTILKVALRSYFVKAEAHSCLLSAMIAEGDVLEEHHIQADPSQVHHRAIDAIMFIKSANAPDVIRVEVGPLEEGARYALGPVRDHRNAQSVLERLTHVFTDGQGSQKKLLLDPAYEHIVLSYLRGTFAHDRKRQALGKFKLSHLWKTSERDAANKARLVIDKIASLPKPPTWKSLLDEYGVAITPAGEGHWLAVTVAHGRPIGQHEIKGDWQTKITPALAKKMADTMKAAKRRHPHGGLTAHEAHGVSSMAWWIGSAKTRTHDIYLPLAEFIERFVK